ncbi:Kelch-like protein 1 [Sciurus carolinensis]|uniref:Kelch-like protein 1 n=1 Tax=Sciurus carolinensis TaxID=30640 RepID=A0AA41T9T4_SCICA|nr:Kelch-like protein 1 [Sciurus carolinensis]
MSHRGISGKSQKVTVVIQPDFLEYPLVQFIHRYDPKTDTWTMVAPLSMPRDAVGVCLLGDRLYAVGGYDGQTYLNTMESYDPQTNEWTQLDEQLYAY